MSKKALEQTKFNGKEQSIKDFFIDKETGKFSQEAFNIVFALTPAGRIGKGKGIFEALKRSGTVTKDLFKEFGKFASSPFKNLYFPFGRKSSPLDDIVERSNLKSGGEVARNLPSRMTREEAFSLGKESGIKYDPSKLLPRGQIPREEWLANQAKEINAYMRSGISPNVPRSMVPISKPFTKPTGGRSNFAEQFGELSQGLGPQGVKTLGNLVDEHGLGRVLYQYRTNKGAFDAVLKELMRQSGR